MTRFMMSAVSLLALSTGISQAADLGGSLKDDPIEPLPVAQSPWAGRYVGFDLGAAFSHGADAETIGTAGFLGLTPDIAPDALDLDDTGFSIAAQLGTNIQSGSLVYGIEGELAYLGLDSEESFTGIPVLGTELTTSSSFEIGANVNLRGRVGIVATPGLLLYMQGGLALANITTSASVVGVDAPGLVWSGENEEFRAGYTLGAGGELKISPKMSLKLSYNFYDFGTQDTTALGNDAVRDIETLNGIDYQTETDLQVSTIRAGLNFAF